MSDFSEQCSALADLLVERQGLPAKRAENLARGMVRAAQCLDRIHVQECNEGQSAATDRQSTLFQGRIEKYAASAGLERVQVDGDPRGFAVKLFFPLKPGEDPRDRPCNTWGGPEVGWGIG